MKNQQNKNHNTYQYQRLPYSQLKDSKFQIEQSTSTVNSNRKIEEQLSLSTSKHNYNNKKIAIGISCCLGGIIFIVVMLYTLHQIEQYSDNKEHIQNFQLLGHVKENKNQPQYQQNTKNYPNFLAIHTEFLVSENIPFIRQWLIYHIHIGVDKFYLYDNGQSHDIALRKSFQGVNQNTNKYGFEYKRLIGKTQQQIQTEWQQIKTIFKDYLIHIKWEPKDQNGKIIYAQQQCILDYLTKYGNQSKYTAFIDIDEFIFSEENRLNLKETLKELQNYNFSRISIQQKKFMDRFCAQQKKVTQIYDCIVLENLFSNKSIIRNQYAIKDELPCDIHTINVIKGSQEIVIPMKQWRLNHYDLNANNMKYIKQLHHNQVNAFEKCYDDSMKIYQDVLNKGCMGKCSDNKQISIKYKQKVEMDNLCWNKNYQFLNTQRYSIAKTLFKEFMLREKPKYQKEKLLIEIQKKKKKQKQKLQQEKVSKVNIIELREKDSLTKKQK